jgi:hypothetical protein
MDPQQIKDAMKLSNLNFGSHMVKYREVWKRIALLPFNSKAKYMITVHQVPVAGAGAGDCAAEERARLLESAGFDPSDDQEYIVHDEGCC